MRLSLLLLAALTVSCVPAAPVAAGPPTPAHQLNKRLARTINFGNMFEAPNEGEWGLRLEEAYFDRVAEAGFTAVRLPIKWSAHAATTPPYKIDPEFAARIDWAVEQALSRKLAIIVDFHHYDELYEHPELHQARFLSLWQQIATRYANRPESVFFEVLNEPHDPLTSAKLNALYARAVTVIRQTNPTRGIILGPTQWNSISKLPELRLPADDRLIATVHTYDPHHFTHQGASWAEGSEAWLGQKWGTPSDQLALRKRLEEAAAWGRANNRPIFLGEFGVYEKADLESRMKWTRFVRSEAERLGMSWGYWEFAAGFGIYDPATGKWREPLKNALLGK